MKVLLLTSRPHWEFVSRTVNQYSEHEFWISEATAFPNEYDVGISFMHLHKVPAEQVNTHPWFNFHPAPLPAYKGRNLCYHAIMNGETEFGATLHYMDENFDTGEIIDVRKFPVYNHYTAEDVSKMAIIVSEALFMVYLPRILTGEQFTCLPNVGGTYYKKEPIPDTMEIDDLSDPVEGGQLATFIRAVYYPPYYPKISIGGVTYKIVRDE